MMQQRIFRKQSQQVWDIRDVKKGGYSESFCSAFLSDIWFLCASSEFPEIPLSGLLSYAAACTKA